jgi:hypothetical protein
VPDTLPAGQSVAVAAIDLRAWFELAEEGFYKVNLGAAELRFSQGPAPTSGETK